MPRPFPPHANHDADRAELERRYRLEKQLADRLRTASADERGALYADVYAAYARGVPSVAEDVGSLELQKRLLAPWLRPEMRIVEVGAGAGRAARSMLGDGRQVVAIEATAPDTRDDLENGLQWLPHDEADRLQQNSFDLAYSCHVIEHLHPDDLPGHFADVLGWLRPGAAYLFVTPNRLLGPHDISAYFADEPEGLHLREYSHGDLARQARRAGFSRVAAVDHDGRTKALWPRLVAETALDLCGQPTRRWLFDGLGSMRRRQPLRPLEQVVLAAFA